MTGSPQVFASVWAACSEEESSSVRRAAASSHFGAGATHTAGIEKSER
jgi:hypothetical protein